MRHKKYNKIVTIERPVYTEDELGDKVRDYSDEKVTLYVSISTEASGRQAGARTVKYDQNVLERLVEIKCHYPKNWKPEKDDIVKHNDTSYQIVDMFPDDRLRELTIEAINIEK